MKDPHQPAKARIAGDKYPILPRSIRFLTCVLRLEEKGAFVVRGIVRRVREDGESYVLYPDPYGIDPPLMKRVCKCPSCGKEMCADHMVINTLPYYCPDGLTRLVYDGFNTHEYLLRRDSWLIEPYL